MLLSFTHYFFLFSVFILSLSPPCMATRPTPEFSTSKPLTLLTHNNYNIKWHKFKSVLNAKRGSHVTGLSDLKKYFHHFGYLSSKDYNNSTDIFDARFESAIIRYQSKLGLPITGKLDFDTVSQIISPRCGVPDDMDTDTSYTVHTWHAKKNYVYFPGKPRWARRIPITLTYAFSPENFIDYLSLSDIKVVFKRAFGKWASVIPVSFVETADYGYADIKIGFYSGDHGDGEAFDGVLGVLAHSFSPESGKFHLDAAETWAVDFESEKSTVAVDLESVAVHEIGHLLGLSHTRVKDAVMYPSLKPRDKKVDLAVDDIEGVQALYGSNPNFRFGSLLESDTSTNRANDLRIGSSQRVILMLALIFLVLHACNFN